MTLAAEAAALARRDKAALGRAVSRVEDARPETAASRAALHAALPAGPGGLVVGVTGAPGVGKSTLIGELALRLVADHGRAVAVIAIDPSSPDSGGALLGDRARVRFPPDERRLFFRSQASAAALGGLAPHSFAVARLLARLFDLVVVETVGVGQSELEVRHLADRTLVVVQPLAGDALQFLKAGLLEVADDVVLNKCELPGAAAVRGQLAAALALGRPGPPRIHAVSARTGAGLAELGAELDRAVATATRRDPAVRAGHFLGRWVEAEYGRQGLEALAAVGGVAAVLARAGSFEAAQVEISARFRPPGPISADD